MWQVGRSSAGSGKYEYSNVDYENGPEHYILCTIPAALPPWAAQARLSACPSLLNLLERPAGIPTLSDRLSLI